MAELFWGKRVADSHKVKAVGCLWREEGLANRDFWCAGAPPSLVVCMWVFAYLLNYFVQSLIWLILKMRYRNTLEAGSEKWNNCPVMWCWSCSLGLPSGISGKEPTFQCRRSRFGPWARKIPWRRAWQPTPVFLLGKSHGQRFLVSYGPWGQKGLDMTKVTEHM